MLTGILLLSDHAVVADGKLYINGGGWSQVLVPNTAVQMGLAIKLNMPWDRTNMPHIVVVELRDADGQLPLAENGLPWRAEANLEVGRPAGLKHGTSLDVPMALNFPAVTLPPGNYQWSLEVDGEEIAVAPVTVLG